MATRTIHDRSGVVAVGALVVTFGGVIGGVTLEGQAPGSPLSPGDVALTAAFLSLPAVGALLVWRRPANAVGWLLAATGVFGGLYVTAHGWAVYALRTRSDGPPGGSAAAWLATWGLVPTFGLLPFVVATFPDGRIERSRLRRLGRFAVAALVALAVAQALAPDDLDGVDALIRPIANPLGVDGLAGVTAVVTFVAVLVVLAFTIAAIGDAIGRYHRASGDERRQLRVIALFPGLIPATIALSFVVPRALVDPLIIGGQTIALVGLSASLGIAVLRYRLYDLGDYLRRTAAYVALSAAVVIAVLALASAVGVVLPSSGAAPAAIAAAAMALALGPLRARLQHGVDRLLFGNRNDPYTVLAEIGAGLEASVSPAAALTDMVDAIASSLHVPYVAIDVDDGIGVAPVRHGESGGPATRLPLVHQHERLGVLVIGHRSTDEVFTERELQLLRDLARQVSVALHAATVTAALQKARLDLVRGREAERQRLRRDIHDGIGPTLAGTMLQLDTLRELIDRQSPDADALAAKVKDNLRRMVEDVRRVSHDLRPPALDALGLAGAIREQVQSLTRGAGLDVDLDVPATNRPLEAAAEVAAYRIVSEALTNVVRHAKARRCSIRLSVDVGIELEVRDDGRGVPDGSTAGIGLVSMRERAAELGGECKIERINPCGTRVWALLPLAT